MRSDPAVLFESFRAGTLKDPADFLTISDQMIVPDDERKIITSVLEKEGLTLSDFCIQEGDWKFL